MAAIPPSARRVGPRSIQSLASSTADNSSSPSNRPSPPKPVTLAKRILFPTLHPDADLPPLLLSPSAALELNHELYDFIALALRAFVNTWWTKLTRYDKEFLPHITRILTVVIRNLESRLLAADLSPLIFRDLPTLLTQHWLDYRNASSKLHTSYAAGGAVSLPQLFHQLQPHMAISPNGVIDQVYVRQAVDHILKVCLPPEDYAPETERYIVREIILKVLLEDVLPKVTQPWFIHKLILAQLGSEKVVVVVEQLENPVDGITKPERPALERRPSTHFSFQTLAILILSAVQSVSGACLAILHAYKQARDTIKKVNESQGVSETDECTHPSPDGQHSYHPFPHARGGTVGQASPELPGTLTIPPKTPLPMPLPSTASSESASLAHPPSQMSFASNPPDPSLTPTATLPPPPPPPPIPDYVHPPLAFVLTMLTPPPSSSPTTAHASFTTARALSQLLTLLASLASPFLARLLPYLLYTHVLSPTMLANVVRNARRALFPEGWPGPPPVEPTPEEQVEMRETLRRRLVERTPGWYLLASIWISLNDFSGAIAPLLGPTPPARLATVDAALSPLDNAACNAHLAVFILDLVLLTVFPELGVKDEV
uniref:MARTX n=1 Tax=Ganoderma boninense TaxID=34458 RepID=A0A5K1K4I4_9APHY|nr:MARTX [Ganoderma boninense]